MKQSIPADGVIAAPVVVGGVGGSGTRVVAEILIELGYYLGYDLNKPCDNLWFTLLFKRRRWYASAQHRAFKPVHKAIRILETATIGQRALSLDERWSVLRAAPEASGQWGLGPALRADHTARVVFNILRQPAVEWQRYRGWGWKEPNSQIFLPHLSDYFTGLRYIQVVRHGLDMAFSRNHRQMHYWGHLFGVNKDEIKAAPAVAALDYWIRSNKQAIGMGSQKLGDRFLMLNYDVLCQQPESEIQRLAEFLDIALDDKRLKTLSVLPKISSTSGRFRQYDLSVFRQDQIDAVQELGFQIE